MSITPPEALRPYFQEGYLVGTDDLTNEYDNKSELDLNTRLIAKFEIPNNNRFWGADFKRIPETALYPKMDRIESICREIGQEVSTDLAPSDLGNFLKLWTEIEQRLISEARKYKRNVFTTRDAIMVLARNEGNQIRYSIIKEFDALRNFRNRLVHNPTEISNDVLRKNVISLRNLWNDYEKTAHNNV